MYYAHRQWPKLTVYLADGRLPIDNNLTENAIRPFVIGRKNFVFCDTVAGAHASANLYSLIETAKANGIEPYAYLRNIFTDLPQATSVTSRTSTASTPTNLALFGKETRMAAVRSRSVPALAGRLPPKRKRRA